MKGFQTYIDYIYLKRHFNEYSFVWNENSKYSKLKNSNFEKRKDRYFFYKIENEYDNRKDVINHLISGFIHDSSFWIGNAFEESVLTFHKERMKKIGSLESHFSAEAEKIDFFLFSNNLPFAQILLTNGTKDPIILKGNLIDLSLETVTIIDHFSQFSQLWFPINPLQQMKRMLIAKYQRLLRLSEYDYQKIENTFNKLNLVQPSA